MIIIIIKMLIIIKFIIIIIIIIINIMIRIINIITLSLLLLLLLGLPIPFRKPLKMVTGEFVLVKQNNSPTDDEVNEVLERVIISVKKLYEKEKPDWELRPLVIT